MDINTKCIVESDYLTGTLYTNICDGTSHFIKFGSADIILLSVLSVIALMLVVMLVVGIYQLIKINNEL